MKKFIGLIFILPALLCTLVSCKSDEAEALKKPYIVLGTSSITVSFEIRDNTKYLNIFRKLKDDNDSNSINIGQIIPAGTSLPAISFEDAFIVSNERYVYRIRYFYSGRYEYSDWSDWPVDSAGNPVDGITNSFNDDDSFKYSVPDGCYFLYDSKTSELTVKGFAISHNALFDSYTPCLVVSSSDSTTTFSIDSFSDSKSFPAERAIRLRDFLTQDFLNKDIYIKGLVYEMLEKKPGGHSFNRVSWSQSASIELKEKDDDGNPQTVQDNKIKVELNPSNDEGYDYSPISFARNASTEVYSGCTDFSL